MRLVQERATPPWGREMLYELETGFREDGWPSEEFITMPNTTSTASRMGEFAFSREYANERRLRQMGIIG